jgi:iron complex outermembrane receptor protein
VTNGLTGTVVLADNHFLAFSGYVKRTLFTEANNKQFNHRTIETPGANVQYTFRYGKADDPVRNTFNVGTDLRWQTVDEHRVANFHTVEGDSLLSKEQINQTGVGIYALDKVDFMKDWSLMLSVRSDQINNKLDDLLNPDSVNLSGSADFSRVTARVGLTWCPMQELNFFASWGQGFLPPSTEELAQNPDRVGGFNTHLTFATSNGFDLGVRGAYGDQVYYDVTGFYLATENDFDRYRVPGMGQGGEGTFYRNVGASHRIGMELFTRYVPVPDVEIQLAYTVSDFKYAISDTIRIMMDDPTDVRYIKDGNRLPNCPQQQIALELGYNVAKDLELGLGVQAYSKSYIDGANKESEAVEGYALFSARIAYALLFEGMHCELSLSARNLADTKYVAFSEPDPGGNAYQPGAGREFFGGLKVRF